MAQYTVTLKVKGNSYTGDGVYAYAGDTSTPSTWQATTFRTDNAAPESITATTYTVSTDSNGLLLIGTCAAGTSGVTASPYCFLTWATRANCSIYATHNSARKVNTYTGCISSYSSAITLKFTGNTILCVCFDGDSVEAPDYVPIYCRVGTNCTSFRIGKSASSYTTVSTSTNTVVFYPRESSGSNTLKVFYVVQSGSQDKAIMKYSSNNSVASPNTDSQPFNVKGTYANGKNINPLYYGRWIIVRCEKSTSTTYTITYNANGGSGSMAAGTKYKDVAFEIDDNGFDPPYIYKYFKNWNTNSGGTGTSYAPGASYTSNANLTLYAQWADITVQVNVGGTWHQAIPYVNVGGTWKQCKPYVNSNGAWQEVNNSQ